MKLSIKNIKRILLAVSLVLLACGILLVFLGAHFYGHKLAGFINYSILDSAISIAVIFGIFTIVIAVYGILIIKNVSVRLMMICCILINISVFGVFLAAILCFWWKNQNLSALTRNVLNRVRNVYGVKKHVTTELDDYQFEHECCGAIEYKDYMGSYWWNENDKNEIVPLSCCKNSEDIPLTVGCNNVSSDGYTANNIDGIYMRGCVETMKEWISGNSAQICGEIITLGIIIIICKIIAFIILCQLKKQMRIQLVSEVSLVKVSSKGKPSIEVTGEAIPVSSSELNLAEPETLVSPRKSLDVLNPVYRNDYLASEFVDALQPSEEVENETQ